MKKLVLSIIVSFGFVAVFAQDNQTPAATENAPVVAPLANPNSYRPISYADIMYQKGVWRKIDLREPQNRPFMAQNRELTRIIMDGLKANKIKAFVNDSLDLGANGGELSLDKVLEKFSYDEFTQTEFGEDSTARREYQVFEVAQLEIREDRIFDRKRSLIYHDIQSVTLIIPGEYDKSGKGLDMRICSFKFKDLCEKVFKTDPRAKWYNNQNDAEHKNFTDAFELRLFGSFITKLSNAKDLNITDIYGGDLAGIMASHWVANELMEYEHNLWEF
jgi:gliding motility associated protien GldN